MPPSKRSLLAFLGACLMHQVTSQNPEVNVRTIECSDSDPPLVGYDRIQDIVNDQQEEFERIESGNRPRSPYIFRLCPNTVFDMATETLPVLLDGIVFTCGPNLSSADSCVFTGAARQVIIEDSTIPDYQVLTASFIGVTFQRFSQAAVGAFASAATTAQFIDCIFQDFQTSFVVNLGSEVGMPDTERMRVEITGGSVVQRGNGGTYFSNNMGTMIFDDVRMSEINAIVSLQGTLYFGFFFRPSHLLVSEYNSNV